jgi:hypothetical protein
MKHPYPLLCALTVPALLALTAPADKVEFHPAEGLALTRTYTSKTELTLDDMEMTMNGQPLPMEIEMDMDMTMSQRTVVTDELGALSEGRPVRLKRSFDELTQQSEFSLQMEMMPDGGQDRSIESESELEGKTVVFAWDADSGAYTTSFDGGEGDETLLEGLEEDMDLRVLLPGTEVSEGDTWELDVKSLRTLLAYGGNLKLVPNDMEGMDMNAGMPGMDSMSDFSSVFGDMLEGEASAEYRGTREIDGVSCAVIHVVVDISASADISDKVRDAMDEMPEQISAAEIEHMDLEMELEGEGDLYWDLAAGVVHSFELSGTTSMAMDMAMALSMGEQSMNMEQNLQLSGTFANALSVTKN